MRKRLGLVSLAMVLALATVAGCGGGSGGGEGGGSGGGGGQARPVLVLDVGGLVDQCFNYSAY